jgi:hypothetical protein
MSTALRMTLLSLGAAALTAVAYAQDTGDTGVVVPARGNIVLVDPLNEAADGDFYCFDVWGDTVENPDGTQAHTCKNRPVEAEDQIFTIDSPNPGNIQVTLIEAEDLCVEMARPRAGAELSIVPCSTSSRQLFASDAAGQIHPASDTSLCLTVSHTRMCGNPSCSNYKRTVALQRCAGDEKFNTWSIPGGSLGL